MYSSLGAIVMHIHKILKFPKGQNGDILKSSSLVLRIPFGIITCQAKVILTIHIENEVLS